MSSLFFDCSKGLSGSMLVGALCDLGAKPSALDWELSQVDLGEFHAHFERVTERGVAGVKFSIHPGAVHTPDQDKEHDRDQHETRRPADVDGRRHEGRQRDRDQGGTGIDHGGALAMGRLAARVVKMAGPDDDVAMLAIRSTR